MIKKFNLFKINEELDFKMIPTKYTIHLIKSIMIPNETDIVYRFLTNKNNSYDLYFSLTYEGNHILSNGSYLKDITEDLIPTIYFSLTDRGLNPDIFDELTDNNEKFEVMSKVIWLINEYDKVYNYKVYSIGEVNTKKYNYYKKYLYNLSQFDLLEGDSDNYNGKKCYYLVNEKW